MGTAEAIDLLCEITAKLAEIVREQALFIENSQTVDEETKKHFRILRQPVVKELDAIEDSLKKYNYDE